MKQWQLDPGFRKVKKSGVFLFGGGFAKHYNTQSRISLEILKQCSLNLAPEMYMLKKPFFCCGLTRLLLVSPQHFDHCDDAYVLLSIRVQAKLNIRFVKYEYYRGPQVY